LKQYDLKEIYELSKTQEVRELYWKISSVLISLGINKTDSLSISTIAAMILEFKKDNDGFEKVKPLLKPIFLDCESHSVMHTFSSNDFLSVDEKLLLALIIGADSEISINKFNDSTPSGVSELVIKLLDIEEGNKVADLCCATGNFLVKAKVEQPNAEYFGCEINLRSVETLKLKASYFNNFVNVVENNVFNLNGVSFDRIFMNHPFGWRLIDNKEANDYINNSIKASKSSFSDWAFVLKALELLKEDGKLITLVSNACLYSGLDKPFRERIVNNKYINTIVSLPDNLFNNTSIPVTMLILTKENNKIVRMVDAKDLYEKNRRKNALSTNNIETILNAIKNETEISASLSYEEIKNNDYSLIPTRYIDRDLTKFKDGVEFNSVIKNVFRGAPLTSSELDALSSNEETDYQYLMLSNIKDGIIDYNMPYLTNIDEKYQKYCIKNRSLLISKNGAPFKIAVAEIDDNKQILSSGNLYVIELDEDKVDPFYLSAFFMSDAGQQLLNKFVVGATIPNLPINDLKKAIIPLPDLDTQKQIAKEYASTSDEIRLLMKKAEDAKHKLQKCFNDFYKEV
jgi:type I restriction enzyme M protein